MTITMTMTFSEKITTSYDDKTLYDGSWTSQASQGPSATPLTTGADNDDGNLLDKNNMENSKKTRNFRQYPVWQMSVDYATKIYKTTAEMPWLTLSSTIATRHSRSELHSALAAHAV